MDSFLIEGGNRLDGKVSVESAKNSVLPILAGCILTTDEVVIENCPKIQDVLCMLKILKHIGVKTHFEENNLIVNSLSLRSCEIPSELSEELRSSVFMIGALISRCGKVDISYPGGCNIGDRPIDIHISSLKKLGVDIKAENCKITGNCDRVKNTRIRLPYPSVGATENVILASVLGDGRTVVFNPAKEPEIKDLADFLNVLGGKISGAGGDVIYIEGVPKLHGGTFKPISDRIEAGTFLIAGAITGGNVEVSNVNAKNIFPLLNKLCDNSCKITINNDIIYLKSGGKRKCFTVETNPYPSFPTDLQAQMMALACVSSGVSMIRESVFETRFKQAFELRKMGADISIRENVALIKGVSCLHGAEVNAMDLRGGASLVLASLGAEGQSIVNNVYHIYRGYLNFDKKIRALNGDIKIISRDTK